MNSIDKYRYLKPVTEIQEDVPRWIICQSTEDYVYIDLEDHV